MTNKSRLGCVNALVSIFVVGPIWWWLLYQILKRVEASELMWFLFWVYVPFGLFARVLAEIGGRAVGPVEEVKKAK
jgi:hypothetical protein